MPNSLTVILPLLDPGACRAEIQRQRPLLEQGWPKVTGLLSACLAILPGAPALLLECTFETDLTALANALFLVIGQELSAVLSHCAEYSGSVDARRFGEYLSSRAQRSFAFAAQAAPSRELELGRCAWRVLDAFSTPSAAPVAVPNEDELEAQRVAVGMQEPLLGVPLVHVAWLLPSSLSRVKRALRELQCEPCGVQHGVRFLLDGSRLLLVAYPSEHAQRWSEHLSQAALGPCARVWRNCRGSVGMFATRRACRERRLEEFVLEHRIPVEAWFNARARASVAGSNPRES